MAKDKKLSTEDRILWGKIARSARPMPGRLENLEELLGGTAEIKAVPGPEAAPSSSTPEKAGRGFSLSRDKAEHRPHHPLERPVKRKLAKGRLTLEARIDLHGMIQSEAHGLLLQFLLRARDRGLRHVLVITGKGTSLGSDGALKRAVPLWFSLPEFRPLISSCEPAARNHGGEGALYVRLARAKGGAS
ncbi:Smr/MutS family protein [Sinorhizobium meliloti]|uniref:Smr/MutS family protein n=1 Tax=Rhizobium meliloti TaxID=382 RepID=UPI000FDA48DB|nr:Smr/MutS family protein [Sinorhizobium meliloti]RVK17936.1 DNA mismatch repair protein MutS [Sinorhizobium meliloti]